MRSKIPPFNPKDPHIEKAFRIAVGDLTGNICLFKDGLLKSPAPCVLAGLEYDTPWTRDAAFNTWYAAGLLYPEAAKNTLLSVLTRDKGKVRIGGQYWDAIIWAYGAWRYFLYNNDRAFLKLAFDAVKNSLQYFEATEFDSKDGLFRGAACFQDGISAYPEFFAPEPGRKQIGGVPEWCEYNVHKRHKIGGGMPCKALSTNCLYYEGYQVAIRMARTLKKKPDSSWARKAKALRGAINTHFWNKKRKTYDYLLDSPGRDEKQEGLGLAFALLFGIASDEQAKQVFKSVYLTAHGISCVWPTQDRYASPHEFGRHSGPIWPQVNTAWALACHARGRKDLALHEIKLLADKACRDGNFIEVYHPETGVPYGGLQEDGSGKLGHFGILPRQTWCATGYIAMALFCLNDFHISEEKPLTPAQRAEILSKVPGRKKK